MTETIPAELIIDEAERMLGMDAPELYGRSRCLQFVRMRRAVYLALRQHTHMSLPQIAARIRGKGACHSLVWSALKSATERDHQVYDELMARVRARRDAERKGAA